MYGHRHHIQWKKRVSYTYCTAKFATGHSYLCKVSSGFAGLLLWSFYKHTVTVLVSQLFSCLTSTYQYRRGIYFMISFQHEDQTNAGGSSHLAMTLHTLRTYMCIKPKQTSTRREHEKHITGTTIRTAKSGFLRTCVQPSQSADDMQVTRRRSCCVLRLSVLIN